MYSVVVTHDNTTYPEGYDPKYNVATCAFSLHGSKESWILLADVFDPEAMLLGSNLHEEPPAEKKRDFH